MEKLSITDKFLKEIVDNETKALVGKLLKRIEVTEYNISKAEKKILKKLFQNLIYEAGRNLEFSIKSYSRGYHFVEFTEFNRKA